MKMPFRPLAALCLLLGLASIPADGSGNRQSLAIERSAGHGGNLMATINYMLIQPAGEKILLFPAWPKDWDVNFKLHAPEQTTVEATLENGKLTGLKVTPESRRKDLVLPKW